MGHLCLVDFPFLLTQLLCIFLFLLLSSPLTAPREEIVHPVSVDQPPIVLVAWVPDMERVPDRRPLLQDFGV